ncbi:MAG: HDOD domain-containing protein [Planctomycetota bacterium]
MSAELCVSPDQLKETLLKRADQLSMLPAVATEAIEMAKDPECKTNEFAGVVERDVKLATEILSMANSAIFGAGMPVSSLRQAVVRLGLKKCRNLIMSSSAASLMKNMDLEQEWVRESIWQHSFRTATACHHLNKALGLGFDGEEFTGGLLHDFGRLLLAIAAPDVFAKADQLTFEEDEEFLSREVSILGIDHCEFGAWFAQHNRLPRSLVAAIRFHHLPEMHHPDSKLIALVSAADHLANHYQRFEESAGYDVQLSRGAHALAKLGFGSLLENRGGLVEKLLDEAFLEEKNDAAAAG